MFIRCPVPSCPSNVDDGPGVIYVDSSSKFCSGCGKSLSDLKIPIEFLFDQLERARGLRDELIIVGVREVDAWHMAKEKYPMVNTFLDCLE